MKKFLTNWLPVLLYGSLIFVVSSLPVQVSSGTDKVLHLFEYALMGFLVTRALLLSWNLSRGWGVFLGTLLGACLGFLDEFHQSFVPGREASVWDGSADALGSLLGALLFVYLGVLLYKTDKLYQRPHDKCC